MGNRPQSAGDASGSPASRDWLLSREASAATDAVSPWLPQPTASKRTTADRQEVGRAGVLNLDMLTSWTLEQTQSCSP